MKWLIPPDIKVYEALAAIADGRVEVFETNATVISSERNKVYYVEFDIHANKITSNDNAAYWQNTLGYPAIACLMKIGILPYSKELGNLLKNIPWKSINKSNNDDYNKTISIVTQHISSSEKSMLLDFVNAIKEQLTKLQLEGYPIKKEPPVG